MQQFLTDITDNIRYYGFKHLQSITLALVAFSFWLLFQSSLERLNTRMSHVIDNASDPISGLVMGIIWAYAPLLAFFFATLFFTAWAIKSLFSELATGR